jgi:hypothetical protein
MYIENNNTNIYYKKNIYNKYMKLIFVLILIILFIVLSKNKNQEIKNIQFIEDESQKYKKFQVARIKHLVELKLNFNNKKILEVGSINRTFAKFISKLNGKITLSTPNLKIYQHLTSKNSKFEVLKLNIEKKEDFENLDHYDYILCYDVLEHLQNPIKAIENMASKTDVIIIESSFSNYFADEIITINNFKNKFTSLNGIGSRFSRSTMYKLLNNHFDYIYSVKKIPNHSTFQKDWENIDIKKNLTQESRDVIIASKKHIQNINLDFGLIKKHY